jgi:FG-GAP-like repeat
MEQDMAGLIQVLYGTAEGTFRKVEVLNGTDDEPLIIPLPEPEAITERICTRPFAVDWNNDGHLDLIVGNFTGTFYWFKGVGKGQFDPKAERINIGDSPLRIDGAHSDPFIVDWDGDGDLDLVSGSSNGGVQWAENLAGKGKMPELAPFQTLVEATSATEYGQPLSEGDLKGPSRTSRVWVDDVNGDGKLDLLVGDSVTLIAPVEGLTNEEFKQKFADWQKAIQAAQEALSKVPEDETARTKAYDEYQKLFEKKAEFMKEEMTGFVWLYLRK